MIFHPDRIRLLVSCTPFHSIPFHSIPFHSIPFHLFIIYLCIYLFIYLFSICSGCSNIFHVFPMILPPLRTPGPKILCESSTGSESRVRGWGLQPSSGTWKPPGGDSETVISLEIYSLVITQRWKIAIYIYIYIFGWWFGTCFIFHFIYGITLPIDELHHFSRW